MACAFWLSARATVSARGGCMDMHRAYAYIHTLELYQLSAMARGHMRMACAYIHTRELYQLSAAAATGHVRMACVCIHAQG